ncbi:MAG: DUF599 domain-containing protein [Methylobacteriaceae bacterium]|nr:DUF599 domain-containing protein [Methylobacteriaceae bacterium]
MLTVAGFTSLDLVAFAFFAGAWLVYHIRLERSARAERSLNRLMHGQRFAWMRAAMGRENRVVDTTINASLQNGTAFFASTSLLAIGASLALLRSTNEVLHLFADLPFGGASTAAVWELKVLGLTVIFVYAFFKFAWAYRLYNYAAILIGALPSSSAPDSDLGRAGWRAASMSTAAGRHFARGQRALFFSVAYLGWFMSATVLFVSTAAVFFVMWRRQFASDALASLDEGPWPEMP